MGSGPSARAHTQSRVVLSIHPNLLRHDLPVQHTFCVSSADERGFPIVYASPGFLDLTGYTEDRLVGHRCGAVLQGPHSSLETKAKMGRALARGQALHCRILNYRANGAPFWSQARASAPLRPRKLPPSHPSPRCTPPRHLTTSLAGGLDLPPRR